MNANVLTEKGWRDTIKECKVKENGLQRALANYEKLEEEKYEERAKAISLVCQLANALKKVKGLAEDAVDYLEEVLDAAETEKAGITKEQAAADKAEEAKKKEAAKQAADGDEDEDEEEEDADYKTKLLAAFQKAKGNKSMAFQFIVCDAKPHCGLMLAKKIGPKHKQQLSEVTGSKRFLHLGTCQFENGKFVFAMEKPVAGLARKLQDSIKNFTGKKLPIKVGTETAEAEEEGAAAASPTQAAAGAAASAAGAKPPSPALAKAPNDWRQARNNIEKSITQMKTAIRKEFAGEAPELIADIEKNMSKLDGILDKLDARLADSLDKARSAKDAAARAAELRNSKTLLADYIKFVKAEPLIAHIDSNPFGVKTNLKQSLTTSLTELARAMAA